MRWHLCSKCLILYTETALWLFFDVPILSLLLYRFSFLMLIVQLNLNLNDDCLKREFKICRNTFQVPQRGFINSNKRQDEDWKINVGCSFAKQKREPTSINIISTFYRPTLHCKPYLTMHRLPPVQRWHSCTYTVFRLICVHDEQWS